LTVCLDSWALSLTAYCTTICFSAAKEKGRTRRVHGELLTMLSAIVPPKEIAEVSGRRLGDRFDGRVASEFPCAV